MSYDNSYHSRRNQSAWPAGLVLLLVIACLAVAGRYDAEDAGLVDTYVCYRCHSDI